MTEIVEKDAAGVEIKVFRVNDLPRAPFGPLSRIKQVMDSLSDFKFREDDILLCTYPKTGTGLKY